MEEQDKEPEDEDEDEEEEEVEVDEEELGGTEDASPAGSPSSPSSSPTRKQGGGGGGGGGGQPEGWRFKLYQLDNEGQWDDKGTGFLTIKNDEVGGWVGGWVRWSGLGVG